MFFTVGVAGASYILSVLEVQCVLADEAYCYVMSHTVSLLCCSCHWALQQVVVCPVIHMCRALQQVVWCPVTLI